MNNQSDKQTSDFLTGSAQQKPVKFWIVTPSYNMGEWLKLCIPSVMDQIASINGDYSIVADNGKASGIGHQASDSSDFASPASASPSDFRLQTPDFCTDVNHDSPRIMVHHHVQDACSTDGTVEFLKEHAKKAEALKHLGYTFRALRVFMKITTISQP